MCAPPVDAAAAASVQVHEAGRLVITSQRLYFQPLHDVAGEMPVRVHPLAAIAAVARRRSSLRPTGADPASFVCNDCAAKNACQARRPALRAHAAWVHMSVRVRSVLPGPGSGG